MSELDKGNKPYDVHEPGHTILPILPGEVELRESSDDLLDFVSAELLIEAGRCIQLGGDFHLAVSGSPLIAKFIERLMYDPDMRRFPWERTHCWLLDDTENGERFELLQSTLVPHSGMDASNLHGTTASQEAPDFDYALLDVGVDGRIGGLHPTEPEGEQQVPVSVINCSKFVALIAMGTGVQEMLQSLVDETSCELPVQGIQSKSGSTKWYLSPTTPEEESRIIG